jgi:hypothetical protein
MFLRPQKKKEKKKKTFLQGKKTEKPFWWHINDYGDGQPINQSLGPEVMIFYLIYSSS